MSTLAGIGTKFYGKKDEDADGTLTTTKWITIFYIPIIPIGTYRVCYLGDPQVSFGCRSVSTSQKYLSQMISIDWSQIFEIYLILIGQILIGLIWTAIINKIKIPYSNGNLIFVCFAVYLIPYFIGPFFLYKSK